MPTKKLRKGMKGYPPQKPPQPFKTEKPKPA